MEHENRYIEYKEDVSKSFLKTVVAFSNYHDGIIIFGIKDDLTVKGLSNLDETKLKIENEINDNIKPNVNYLISTNRINNTIALIVKKGKYTPYYYKDKSYKRNDTSTIEIDKNEEKELILEGMNLNFEDIDSKEQHLTFKELDKELKDKLNLDNINKDIYKTLSLINDNGKYNIASYLLSDLNSFNEVDLVIYGKTINEIKYRERMSRYSLIYLFKKVLDIFEKNYKVEIIKNETRETVYKIPFLAFREALANSLIHRNYNSSLFNKIEMYEDKIIIVSIGGLLNNITKDDFINGKVSSLRNPIIASIFHRLKYCELLATGIKKINECYSSYSLKNEYEITPSSVTYILPTLNSISFTNNELLILNSLVSNKEYKRKEIEEITSLSKDIIIRCLNNLIKEGVIIKQGVNKDIKYLKK